MIVVFVCLLLISRDSWTTTTDEAKAVQTARKRSLPHYSTCNWLNKQAATRQINVIEHGVCSMSNSILHQLQPGICTPFRSASASSWSNEGFYIQDLILVDHDSSCLCFPCRELSSLIKILQCLCACARIGLVSVTGPACGGPAQG